MQTTSKLIKWIQEENRKTAVEIKRISFEDCTGWLFDQSIHRPDDSFFSIRGAKIGDSEQPIIIQNEIGFLGIIAKWVGDELHFLMQAKIEPGNINCVQISPTIQATKSNFTQKHGGRKPMFLDYFLHPKNIIVDQLQSEQSSRFLKKRNRNMIVLIDEEIPESNKFKWISLSQIKKLMRYDNLVNMDTRTVISCLPLRFMDGNYRDAFFNNSLRFPDVMGEITAIYNYINNHKMFDESLVKLCSLFDLSRWTFTGKEIIANYDAAFKVCFFDIKIDGREVKQWCQPLFEATTIATFGLVFCEDRGAYKFLVRAKPEIGCFDKIEIGPSVQIDDPNHVNNEVENLFFELCKNKNLVMIDVLLSEEGGRFYHEQNKNVIVKSRTKFDVPEGYFWVSFGSLNILTQVNNCLNIQLRNLLSLLEFEDEKN